MDPHVCVLKIPKDELWGRGIDNHSSRDVLTCLCGFLVRQFKHIVNKVILSIFFLWKTLHKVPRFTLGTDILLV